MWFLYNIPHFMTTYNNVLWDSFFLIYRLYDCISMSVVMLTPTYNRAFTQAFSTLCMQRQTVKCTWIIIDNSDSPEQGWTPPALENVIFIRIPERKSVGALRNLLLDEAMKLNPAYVGFWDDDDYYVPKRIENSIRALTLHPLKDIVGCSIMNVFLTRENVLTEVGPYSENSSTAATFFMRAHVCSGRRFADVSKSEEPSFLRDFTLPMISLPSRDVLLVIGHSANTCDKSVIFTNPRRFGATIKNTSNAKNIVRFQWMDSDTWDVFTRTFQGALGSPPTPS